MSTPAVISIEGLSKRYVIGRERGHGLLRDKLSGAMRSLARTMANPSTLLQRDSSEDDFWALRNISFEVNQGEIIGIIGRNGAGKSTLLKILSRITDPTEGRIRIRGRLASLLEVGTGFHPELSGRENIFLNGAILGMSRTEIRAKFDQIVSFAEVERFLDTPVKHYSSGMYVRLAFAVAAHLEPDILVVDEVLAVGDQEFQRKCLGKLESVTRQEGRTVLFVSHNLAAVRHLCSRALLLHRGELICSGSSNEVIGRYLANASDRSSKAGYKHIQGDQRASISSIDIQSSHGHEPVFAIYDEMRVILHYECRQELGPIEFFLLIYADDGECLLSIFQKDSGQLSRSQVPGGSTSLSLSVPFAPGRYLVSAGIFDGNRQFLDWVEFAETFQVESGFSDGRSHDHRLGRLSIIPKWQIQ